MAAVSTQGLLFDLLRYNVLQTLMAETEKTTVYTKGGYHYIPNFSRTLSVSMRYGLLRSVGLGEAFSIYLEEVIRERAGLQSSKCNILHMETNRVNQMRIILPCLSTVLEP